jgi:quercetin dioxygenase-like cupin family protein
MKKLFPVRSPLPCGRIGRGLVVLLAGSLAGFAAATAPVFSQEPQPLLPAAPPSHNVVFQVETPAAAQYDEELSVLDFDPGAWTYERKHDGTAFFSVVDGSLTVRADSKDTVYRRGESFRQDVGKYYSIGNQGNAKARLIVTTLTSPGLSAVELHPEAARPTRLPITSFTGKATLTTIPARFTLNQAIFEFQPGAGSGAHIHPSGQGLQIVMNGQQRHRLLTGDIVQGPGDVLHDLPNRPISHENRGSEPMVDVVSYVFYGTPAAVPASIPGVQPLPAPATGAQAPSGQQVAQLPAVRPPTTGSGGLLQSPASPVTARQ